MSTLRAGRIHGWTCRFLIVDGIRALLGIVGSTSMYLACENMIERSSWHKPNADMWTSFAAVYEQASKWNVLDSGRVRRNELRVTRTLGLTKNISSSKRLIKERRMPYS